MGVMKRSQFIVATMARMFVGRNQHAVALGNQLVDPATSV
jgi:hypothetical protein